MTNRRGVLTGLLVAAAVLMAGCSSGSPVSGTPGAGGVSCTNSQAQSGLAVSGDQLPNAQAIAAVAIGLGLGQAGVLVGILTADVESDLHNINVGDMTGPGGTMSTSRGLFQQIAAWGPEADRMDPTKSATMFYMGGQAGQTGLTQVGGWQSMDPGAAMQAVQGSQFAGGTSPGYAQKLAFSTQVANAVGPACQAKINTGNAATPGGGGAGAVSVSWNGPTVTIPNDPNVDAAVRGKQLTTGGPGIARGLAAGFAALGMPYVWGGGGDGAGPNNGCSRGGGQLNSCGSEIGFDCSGLTAYVIVQAGFPSPGGESGSQAQASHAVAWPGAPGDIIHFPGHVAIDLGDIGGKVYILEASEPGTPIRVVPMFRTDNDPTPYRYWTGGQAA